jgi:hypothetical protein
MSLIRNVSKLKKMLEVKGEKEVEKRGIWEIYRETKLKIKR